MDYFGALTVQQFTAENKRLRETIGSLRAQLLDEQARTQRLRFELAAARTGVDGVWFWQGDGHDKLESLTCPVVMSAQQLRAFVGLKDIIRRQETCFRCGKQFADVGPMLCSSCPDTAATPEQNRQYDADRVVIAAIVKDGT
jgi:ribosomal protein L37E